MKLYSVFKWFDGEDKSIELFASAQEAHKRALTHTMEMWDNHFEDDWPLLPITWKQAYERILERAGNTGDEIEVNEHDLTPWAYVVGQQGDDTAVVCDKIGSATTFIEDQIRDGEDPDFIELYEAWPRYFTCEVERVVSSVKIL